MSWQTPKTRPGGLCSYAWGLEAPLGPPLPGFQFAQQPAQLSVAPNSVPPLTQLAVGPSSWSLGWLLCKAPPQTAAALLETLCLGSPGNRVA